MAKCKGVVKYNVIIFFLNDFAQIQINSYYLHCFSRTCGGDAHFCILGVRRRKERKFNLRNETFRHFNFFELKK